MSCEWFGFLSREESLKIYPCAGRAVNGIIGIDVDDGVQLRLRGPSQLQPRTAV